MAFKVRMPSFIVTFLRARRWVMHYAYMQFRHLQYKHKRNQESWGIKTPLAKSFKNFYQNTSVEICFELDLRVRGAEQFLILPSEKAAQ